MALRRSITAAALALSGLCGCSDGAGAKLNGYVGDGSFGSPYKEPDAASGDADSDAAPPDDGGFEGTRVRLRVLQGVINLRAAYLCHDPDYDVNDPDAGGEPPTLLALDLGDAGALEPGKVTAYASLPSMTGGAITVHRAPSLDGGLDAAVWDAGAPDAGNDAASDGGGADGDIDAAPPRCDPASLEAVLPLPMPSAWVDPARDDDASSADGGPTDAGLSPEARGFVSTASGGDTLTLFGSGLLIQASELQSRIDALRQRYVSEHPGADNATADAWAQRQGRILEASYGPRFLLSRAVPAGSHERFALLFSHLIPDVPQPQSRADAGSGPLHLCVTAGSMEGSELADAGTTNFEFRNYTRLGDDLDPGQAYRFRVFVQAAYEQEQKTCATTSLKPVAELLVDAGTFAAGSSYSLVAWGALSPESICTSYTAGSLIRPGCALGNDALRARLEIIDNDEN